MLYRNKRIRWVEDNGEMIAVYRCLEHGQTFCPDLGQYCTDCYEEDMAIQIEEYSSRESWKFEQ